MKKMAVILLLVSSVSALAQTKIQSDWKFNLTNEIEYNNAKDIPEWLYFHHNMPGTKCYMVVDVPAKTIYKVKPGPLNIQSITDIKILLSRGSGNSRIEFEVFCSNSGPLVLTKEILEERLPLNISPNQEVIEF